MANAKEARIDMYFHCKTCLKVEEKDGQKVPVDYGEHLAVGWTKEGLQVVCENCGKNIIDIDFCGIQVRHFEKGRPYIKVCPKCGTQYHNPPAISRRDNKTEICSNCGTKEALEDYYSGKEGALG